MRVAAQASATFAADPFPGLDQIAGSEGSDAKCLQTNVLEIVLRASRLSTLTSMRSAAET